jgi:hypothetical protein
MSVVNRDLGANIYLVLFGHGLLALGGLSLVVARIPLPATVALIVVCVLFWLHMARIALPIANRLWREPAPGTPAKEVIAHVA